jgi:hypothetical protein
MRAAASGLALRLALLASALAVPLALDGCHDTPTTGGGTGVQVHSLSAVTSNPGDSIACFVFAILPFPDSIRAWSGTADVRIVRGRVPATSTTSGDTTLVAAAIAVSRGASDTITVRVRGGGVTLDFTGRELAPPYEATGAWQCDDRIPLSRLAPGRALGEWRLESERPID